MKYNTRNETERDKAFEYLTELIARDSIVEIKKVSPVRSLNQNSYLHLLLSAWGAHFGYTLEEAKLLYKELNASIYRYEKKDRQFYKSSALLTKDEMTLTIEKFRAWSDKHGFYLPEANEEEHLRSLENTIEGMKRYL